MDSSRNDNINAINDGNRRSERVFNFTGKRKISLVIVLIIIAVGMTSFFIRGFNWDIDFVGGTILEYQLNTNVTADDTERIRGIVGDIIGAANVSNVVTVGTQGVSIRMQQIESEDRERITLALSEIYEIDAAESTAQNVDATVGRTLTHNTIMAVVIALALMLVYITIRFKFFSGLSTVLCLTHDMFVALTFYSLLQIPMNMAVIAAFLTILAYSINTTIIIFDRVRENMRLLRGSNKPFNEIINISVTQTLTRSINTTVSTLFVLVCVYIIGVPSIQAFVLPIIIGILAGVFSSLFLAGTIWDLLDGLKNRKANTGRAE